MIEAYGERTFQPRQGLIGIRVGRYRTPFGISSASDHAYIGFLRAPLIRYDDYFALSNSFLEHGADVIVGTPRLSLEASIGVPADVGTVQRRSGVDTVMRGQSVFGPADRRRQLHPHESIPASDLRARAGRVYRGGRPVDE